MAIVIYNSQTHKKEEFVSLVPGQVKMYACGPTVYGLLHVGNFRGAVVYNLVRNWLEYRKYNVNFVYNYTDVDDKIIAQAKIEGMSPQELSEKYIREFEKDFSSLKLRKHSKNPRVTEFMNPILDFVNELVEKDKAYVVEGDVYFDVHSISDYGKLSKKNLDDLESGVRIDVDSRKKHPADFALWKSAKEGEPSWSSPWGQGRPGWHIECSAMSKALLGETLDIHGGGLDLLFPHHENEMAQSEGLTGKPFVRYWMHNNMLNFGSQKMSKSLGNVRTARAFLSEYNPEIYKYLMLSAHYRSIIDFSPQQIDHVISALARIYSTRCLAQKCMSSEIKPGTCPADFKANLEKARTGIEQALDDDFNTPEAFARMFEVIRHFNSLVKTPAPVNPVKVAASLEFASFITWLGELTSLFLEPPQEYLRLLDDMLLNKANLKRQDIDQLVSQRAQARANKDFAKSDELRNQLQTMGIAVQDSASGSEWEVAK